MHNDVSRFESGQMISLLYIYIYIEEKLCRRLINQQQLQLKLFFRQLVKLKFKYSNSTAWVKLKSHT